MRQQNKNNKLIVILGPTASGKTGMSVKLAKKYNGEIISADSRQVYKGLNIGSGKITKKEMQSIPHYLLDVANPKNRFSAFKYQKLTQKAIKKIQKKNKQELAKLINKRLITRLKNNAMINEVKKLHKQGISWKRFEELGLEYKFVAQYLQNKITNKEMQQKIQIESLHFAKRQMTWFKRDKRIKWVNNYKQAEKLVKSFLKRGK